MRRRCIVESRNKDTGELEYDDGFLLGFSVDSYSTKLTTMVYQYPVALVEFKDEDTGEHFVGVVNLEEDNIIFKDADDL